MSDNFQTLLLDLCKAFVPAMVMKYKLDNSILLYYLPLVMLFIYISKKYIRFIPLFWMNQNSITLKNSIMMNEFGSADRNYYYAIMHYIDTECTVEGHYFIPVSSSLIREENKQSYGSKVNKDKKHLSLKLALHDNHKININFKNTFLNISGYIEEKEKQTILYMTIEGSNIQLIKQFIFDCHHKYRQYIKDERRSKRLVFSGIKDCYDEHIWSDNINELGKSFDNLFIDKKLKENIISDIDVFLNSKERYKILGTPYKRGYLFNGPPGTGKSSTYYAIEEKTRFNIYKLVVYGTPINIITNLIRDIPPRSILVIDDVDRIPFNNTNKQMKYPEGNNDGDIKDDNDSDKDSDKKEILVDMQTILGILDGYDCLNECIIVMTSNYKEKLDDALIRSGRIDFIANIDYPSYETINDTFKYLYKTDNNIKLTNDCKLNMADIIQKIIIPYNDYDKAVIQFNNLINV